VEISLRQLIERELAQLDPQDSLEVEQQAHEVFRQEWGRVFVGREEPLAAIAAYVTDLAGVETTSPEEDEDAIEEGDHESIEAQIDAAEVENGEESAGDKEEDQNAAQNEETAVGPPLLVIHGPDGSGKSTLLAQAIAAARTAHPKAVVVQRFIGASPASVSLRVLLSSLCQEIARAYSQPETLPEGDMKALIAAFAERLDQADTERPLFVFIDALDQLVSQDEAQPFEWLPETLPPVTRLVVSVLEGPAWAELQQRRPEVLDLAIPAMTAQEAEAMLDALLADATLSQPARRLTPVQRATLLQHREVDVQPLWLKLAVIEAKRWRSYQKPMPLAATTPALLYQFFARLQGMHGELLVKRALAYLTTSRHGLNDDEMRTVLWRDGDVHAEFDRRKNPDQPPVTALPPMVWSRLYFDLEPYLIERAVDGTNCYAFYHRQFGDAVQTAFLSEAQRLARHRQLAAYFRDCGARAAARRPQLRTLAELPWQQIHAGQAAEVERTLTDFDFAMAKCEAREQADLVEDYRRALVIMKPPSQTFRLWENFFRSRRHILDRADVHSPAHKSLFRNRHILDRADVYWPAHKSSFRSRRHILDRADVHWPAHKILLQLAVEHANESPVTQAAERWLEQGYCDWVWLRNPQRVKEVGIDPYMMLLEGENVGGVQPLPNERWSSRGKNLRIWDLATERCVAMLEGHTRSVNGVLVLADGRLLSWSDADGTLRLWDGATGAALGVLKRYTKHVVDTWKLADGWILSSADWNETLWLWDGLIGDGLAVPERYKMSIQGVRVLADGRLLSWSYDILRLWDGTTGAPLAVLEGHTCGVIGVTELADGRLLSWSRDNILRLWDGAMGAPLAVLEGHTCGAIGVTVLADGRLLSWSGDGTLRLWDGATGAPLAVLEGHTSGVIGVTELADGRLLSWSDDGTLRLWDGATGAPLAVLEGHTGGVIGVTELADGRLLSYSYDGTLRLWDGTMGTPLAVLEGHTHWVVDAMELTDGRLLSCSYDGTLRLWEGGDGRATGRAGGAYPRWGNRRAGAGGRATAVVVESW